MATWQLSRRVLRRLKVGIRLILTLGFLYVLPSLLVAIPAVQRFLAKEVSIQLSELFHAPVFLESISIEGWRSINLSRVYILDSVGRRAIDVEEIKAGIELEKLLVQQKVFISSARLFSPDLLVDYDSISGQTNVQHILDALASNSDEPSTLIVDINNILVRSASIKLLRNAQPLYQLANVNLQASQLLIAPDSLTGILNELSLSTPEGFTLQNLSGQVRLRGDKLTITQAQALLPHSTLNLPQLVLNTGKRGIGIVEMVNLEECTIDPQDISPLVPLFSGISSSTLQLSAQVHQTKQELRVQDLSIHIGNSLQTSIDALIRLDAIGQMQGANVAIRQFALNIPELQRTKLINLSADTKPSIEPILYQLLPLGQVNYQGQVDYQIGKDFVIDGLLSSELGRCTLKGSGELSRARLSALSAELSTSSLNLRPLLGSQAGPVKGAIRLRLKFPEGKTYPMGESMLDVDQFTWGQYPYRKVRATITSSDATEYKVHINSQDANLPLTIRAAFAVRGDVPTNIKAQVLAHNLRLSPFVKGLDHVYIESSVQLADLNLDRLKGQVSIPMLRAEVNGERLNLSDTYLTSETIGAGQRLRLKTPWIRLALEGQYNWQTLRTDLLASMTNEIPVLQTIFGRSLRSVRGSNRFSLSADIDSIPRQIGKLLNLPIEVRSTALLSASIDSYDKSIDLAFACSRFGVAEHDIENLSLQLNSHELNISGDAFLYGGTQLIGAQIKGIAVDNELRLSSDWGHDRDMNSNGQLNMSLNLYAPQNRALTTLKDLNAILTIDHSNLRIHTALWDVSPAKIIYSGGAVQVEGLSLSTKGRCLAISGGLGNWQSPIDGISIQLENINLRYILEAAGVYFDLIDTDLTGVVSAKLVGKNLVASAQVKSPNFFVNKVDVGAIDIGLGFSLEDMLIRLSGQVIQSNGGYSQVAGWIKPEGGAGIDLDFDAHRLDISFLYSFMDGFLSQLSGRGTGQIRLHGLFEDGVTVEGDADVSDGKVGIRALGTQYSFNHPIHLDDSTIYLHNVQLVDVDGNSGQVNGTIAHKYFGDFKINLQADIRDKLKVLQTSSPKDFPAYGNAYASGRAKMTGTDLSLKVDVSLTSEEGTDVRLDFDQLSAGRDASLMYFTNLRDEYRHTADTIITESYRAEMDTDIDLSLNLNITPQAKVSIQLGEDAGGGVLSGRGDGGLQIHVPSSGSSEVYGTVNVQEGEYVFTLQQFARKRFVLREGGNITFRGDPMRANLQDLRAIYALTANIADLDESISQITSQTNIPVNCVLSLSGEVSKPDIHFGIELPRADAEIERRVKAFLNTEDAITRQMLYLIALGKFYTEDTRNRSTTTTNNWTAVASNAISEQLSSLLANITEAFRLGTSIKTKSTAFEDTDIELNFSGSLFGNRLTINGNVGYHDNPYLNNQYLGEFDFEYKLNRSGTLRLKGYNHYNTMYQYLRQSLLTQGFGVLYRQRFDSLGELLRPSRYKRDSLLKKDIDTLSTETK